MNYYFFFIFLLISPNPLVGQLVISFSHLLYVYKPSETLGLINFKSLKSIHWRENAFKKDFILQDLLYLNNHKLGLWVKYIFLNIIYLMFLVCIDV